MLSESLASIFKILRHAEIMCLTLIQPIRNHGNIFEEQGSAESNRRRIKVKQTF